MSEFNVYTLDAGWPDALVPVGGQPNGGTGFGAADDHLVRLGSLDAGVGSVLKTKQSCMTGSPASPPSVDAGLRCGVIGFASTDCGSTWNVQGVIDTCDPVYAPAFDAGADTYYCNPTQSGLDRNVLTVSALNPANAWITAHTVAQDYLFTTTNAGASWNSTPARYLGPLFFAPTVEVGDHQFFFYMKQDTVGCNSNNYGRYRPAMKTFDGTALFSVYTPVGSEYLSTDCEGFEDGPYSSAYLHSWISATPIGQFSGKSGQTWYVRVAYPMATGIVSGSRQFYRVRLFQVANLSGRYAAYDLGSFDIASSAGSILQLGAVPATPYDFTPGVQSSVAFYYWMETDLPGVSGAGWGNMRIKGCVVRDLDLTCTPITLSVDSGGAERASPTAAGSYWMGDYQEGSFFYDATDPAGKTFKFIAQWVERGASDASLRAVHTNIVRVAP